jgi:hypothetical protein
MDLHCYMTRHFSSTHKKPAEAGSFLAINDILSANILSAFILEMARHP